jgi:hypothetical protein
MTAVRVCLANEDMRTDRHVGKIVRAIGGD